MLTALEQFDLSQILQPVQNPQDARQDAVKWGASLTIARGQAIAIKTSDHLAYAFNPSASDGTQNFAGFSMYTLKTDANNLVYFGGVSTTPSYRLGPYMTAPIWTKGTFNPQDVSTNATGTAVAEVDTFTPASPTTGDIYSVTTAGGDEASFVIGATQTAAAAVTGMTNSWNSNPVLVALATASGSTTFILTGVNPGVALNLTSKVVGTGTFAKVQTTAPVSGITAQVLTFTPTTVTTGDVNTITYTYPDGTVGGAASFTVGATQTATAVVTGLIAAWNANAFLKSIATPSGSTTFILTSKVAGNADAITGAVVGTGTIPRVVTTAALGRNLADIQVSCPGARLLHNGFWYIP